MNQTVKHIAISLRAGDSAKWRAYDMLSKAEQLAWRRQEGHAEFCRLQRLWFWGFL